MQFDSHVMALLSVTVRLVNRLTPGSDGGRDVRVPKGAELVAAVAEALADGGPRARVDQADATSLAAVATAARAVFDDAASGDVDAAAEQVNLLLDRTRARPRLDFFPAAGWSLHFHGPDDTLAVGWSAGIASGLALALGSDLAGRLGVCAAPSCDRVYVDTSRNGGRRFCSTRCQSRVKAAVHRSRSASAD
jgi:predicted RNA-binding Zn ribbon-like protein